ncbi:YhjD/YihY/BrkB family envelope integrity protein [Microbacterium sp. Leaf159]|uniref:YhjD/YihY/BrkB family envelope integrity protein n=1 Tax=Microbacterium sp. Leaf159 TaxID=1736279 RepID=UPI000700B528|nr:YhjD/YihY/BrkB family envelope integrity protein [Microbacterium sp. Leaf159]KQR38721.1 ribonuclease BN [Microbacterium sp. Leaf159]
MSSESATPDADRPGLIPRVSAAAIRWALRQRPVRAFLLYSERRGPMLADSVTYRALFSVFAAVLLGFSIAALWLAGNPEAWDAIIAAVQSVVPGLIGEDGIIDPSDLEAPVSLSIAGAISVVALTGSALAAVGSLRTAVRLLAGTAQADILFIWVMLRNLVLAIGIGLAFVAAAAVTFIGRIGITWISGLLGIAEDSPTATWSIRIVSLVVVLALDTALIAGVFRLLSGTHPSARSLWTGALLGGIGLLILQELSGLFIGGATSNPLLASFASLLALLIWLNLSTQVILISCAYIVTSEEERHDRVHARFGATTFPQRRVQRAEAEVALATTELRAAQKAEKEFRTGSTAG